MSTFSAEQDPSSVMDWAIDWTRWFPKDKLLTSNWTATGGLSIVSHSKTLLKSTVFVSGSASGEVVNTVTTEDGRTDQRSIYVYIVEK